MNSMVGTYDNTFPFRPMHLIVAQLTIPALLRNLKGEKLNEQGLHVSTCKGVIKKSVCWGFNPFPGIAWGR